MIHRAAERAVDGPAECPLAGLRGRRPGVGEMLEGHVLEFFEDFDGLERATG